MENPIEMDDLGGKPHYFRKHPFRFPEFYPKKGSPQIPPEFRHPGMGLLRRSAIFFMNVLGVRFHIP